MFYSFDVFDTLITRTTATPRGIFAIVDRRLQIDNPGLAKKLHDSFFNIRVKAELAARKIYCENGVQDITLDQIYHMFGTMTVLSSQECSYLKSIEIETEYDNSVPIKTNIDRIKELKESDNKIALISDMYLSSEEIRHLLLKHDAIFQNIPIYVSSEIKKTKWSGEIYHVVRHNELVLWSDWLHYGDNKQSDYDKPMSLGISAELYAFPGLYDCEKTILGNRCDDAIIQIYIGTSRNNRICCKPQIARYFGGMYGTAILLQYIYWVINICKELEISTLYFVARDGYILHEMAKILKEKNVINYELKYIYGSRKAWITTGDISDDVDNKNDYLKNESELTLVKDYIKQEIDLSAKHIGFVEVHGRGETQLCFAKMIKELSSVQMSAFYYGLERDQVDNNIMDFYRFTQEISENGCVIEALSRALHGRTIGYKKDNNIVKPILVSDEEVILEKYGYNEYISAVLTELEEFIDVLLVNNISLEQFSYGVEYHDYLVNHEKGDMLEFIAELPLSDTVKGEDVILRFAPKPTDEEIGAVKTNGYLKYKSWCYTISKRRLTSDDLLKIAENTEIYRKSIKEKNSNSHVTYKITDAKVKGRIVLYGNGKVGKALFKYISEHQLGEIIAWTDASIKSNDDTYITRESLKEYSYEQIIIAVKSEKVAEEIKFDLRILGVDESLIYWEDYERIES